MLTVFVGNNDQHLADSAVMHDKAAYLIDCSNYNHTHKGTIYVSLADLNSIQMFNIVLSKADIIIYVPSDRWTDAKQKYWTERSVQIFNIDSKKTVINSPVIQLNPSEDLILKLIDFRKSDTNQLWVAGCSTTAGVGVNDNQKYASLLSQKLNVPYSLLAEDSSSISWAADQILRSNIKENDIIVWGLTNENRFQYFTDTVQHILAGRYPEFNSTVDIKHLDDSNLKYRNLTSIYQVVNYCAQTSSKLIIAGIHISWEFAYYLKDLSCYLHLNNFWGINDHDMYLDFGSDHMHPGPKTHEWYAGKIFNKIKEI
jgi:hypothetical protein